ncbi:MAG: hypothetical protein ACRDCT_33150 [Shewanella sp.]
MLLTLMHAIQKHKGKAGLIAIFLSWVIFTTAAMQTNLSNSQERPTWVTYAFLGTSISTSYIAVLIREP